MLNSLIKFDLHIHSYLSEYKESEGIVNQSTKENLSVLLSNLNQHNISLFSITDHNRFDAELYLEIYRLLAEPNNPYPNVKAALAGIEFDVILDESMSKCHIIVIFDAKCDISKLKQIENSLSDNLLIDPQQAYSKNEFESILKKIGLNAILIASQRKEIHNHNGNHNSLSDSAANVEQIIRLGYINALEFQKPKVEGILLSNLKSISLPVPLFSGSDCHDWSHYPYHDSKNQNKEFHHSKAKILPTFKGLLMAITSPETRFNCSSNINTCAFDGILLKESNLPLVNGINAIIGENGSGKTTLLKLINGKTHESHVKKLIQNNDLQVSGSFDPQKVKYIEQGQIIKKFNEGTIFNADEENNFLELDVSPFRESYTNYSNSLKKAIEVSIKKHDTIKAMSKYSIKFEEGMTAKNYFIDITDNEKLNILNNPHDTPRKNIEQLFKKVNSMLSDKYFDPYKDQLKKIIQELSLIKYDITQKWLMINYEATVKNIMHGCINDYLRIIKENSSAKDREIKDYSKRKQSVVESVMVAIEVTLENIEWPEVPSVLEGATKNPKQGFYFNREAVYNNVSMIDTFYLKMFVKEYNCIKKLQSIHSFDQLSDAIRTCNTASNINTKWAENFEKFISDSIKTNDYIMDGAEQQIGNTLGELSLSYYKYFTQDTQDWTVLIVDQPEDNISNNNISQRLISYFNAIRDQKQIIFVTHNPLLVVNLDVDNVIFIKNNKGLLSASNGCLEYEDDNVNILELIAQNMDGGKETIEKRLMVYGKNY